MTDLPPHGQDETVLPRFLPHDVATAQKRLLSPEEFYQAFGGAIGRSAVYELLRAHRVKHVRFGRKFLIPRSELDDFPLREASLCD